MSVKILFLMVRTYIFTQVYEYDFFQKTFSYKNNKTFTVRILLKKSLFGILLTSSLFFFFYNVLKISLPLDYFHQSTQNHYCHYYHYYWYFHLFHFQVNLPVVPLLVVQSHLIRYLK